MGSGQRTCGTAVDQEQSIAMGKERAWRMLNQQSCWSLRHQRLSCFRRPLKLAMLRSPFGLKLHYKTKYKIEKSQLQNTRVAPFLWTKDMIIENHDVIEQKNKLEFMILVLKLQALNIIVIFQLFEWVDLINENKEIN